ncbi:acid phosphatase type 7-like isoform X1 [Gigantopelta aegis]|uniref:acid phosphatase type 7-like isoform X1 n=1 Tax=Gigantopelta aegis TaxID=1735272 RepID=UPI001B88AC02|nr:acid phosphatase type 7-like isoform X1 [Gigantopelta aegis]
MLLWKEDNARVGDEFMRQLEPVAAYIPYMVCVGNHENAYNFSHYRKRFTMPVAGGDGEANNQPIERSDHGSEGMWFSWNIGKAHVISFSTEVYYYSVTRENIKAQYDWLDKDLTEANQPINREKRPWIIVMGHKPMYCSNTGGFCNDPNDPVRVGIKVFNKSLEELFYKHGVDLEFYAHEHSYERMWPIYKHKICNGSYDKPYMNPRAPVHIVTGSAGNREGQSKFIPSERSAFHTDDFGYTRMIVQNASHLYLEEMSVNKGGAILDKIWIVKDKHGTGIYDCHI